MAKCSFFEHIVTEDDPNLEIRGYSIRLHNQGTTVININQERLLPDDYMLLEADGPNDEFIKRIRIFFGDAFPFNRPLSDYPQLWSGNRLLVKELRVIQE